MKGSHTGYFITLGRGPIFAKSTKQKLVSKSSTEAELIGWSDSTPMVMWVQHFLEGQGYPPQPFDRSDDRRYPHEAPPRCRVPRVQGALVE
mmetsp:Transcript_23737/g.33973  ORF Transcript_23737/g.33973 Transcript_23737/m.33973 type:complete len:91 (+) Transcript_23737:943-1215(+)